MNILVTQLGGVLWCLAFLHPDLSSPNERLELCCIYRTSVSPDLDNCCRLTPVSGRLLSQAESNPIHASCWFLQCLKLAPCTHASATWQGAPRQERGQALTHVLGSTKAQLLLFWQEKPEVFTFYFIYKEEIPPCSHVLYATSTILLG